MHIAERNKLVSTEFSQNPLRTLASSMLELNVESTSEEARRRLQLILIDSLGVGIAGSNTSEHQALLNVWPMPEGPARIWGSRNKTDVRTATLLNGTALCSLELDEGNRLARGHPAAHVIPAVLAEAQRLNSPGSDLLNAVISGYEAATRIAGAFKPREGLHPHGHWGAIGAAAAVSRLHGFDVTKTAMAMDAASGLALASPFSSAIEGAFVRNLWVGAAGVNGLSAVRLVQAGLGSENSTFRQTFGSILGNIEEAEIRLMPDAEPALTRGYIKRHSSCAYTHSAADAAIAIHEQLGPVGEISKVTIDTYALAAPLSSREPRTRLAAMFSLPHVVAVALKFGKVTPNFFDPMSLLDPELARLRNVTSIAVDPEIDSAVRKGQGRGARVSVTTSTGDVITKQVPNAIGDFDFEPFDLGGVLAKLHELIGEEASNSILRFVESLSSGSPIGDLGFPDSITGQVKHEEAIRK